MNAEMTIKTNNHVRKFYYLFELPKKVQEEEFSNFEVKEEHETDQYIKYKGNFYSFGNFMRLSENHPFPGWDGYSSDSFFSGLVIKLLDDGESYIIGTYFS
jgi:hypothetical protein